MNILFVGYWGANEGLSQSTINPHLEILARREDVESIHYVSMERNPEQEFFVPDSAKIHHNPYWCSTSKVRVFNKFIDLVRVFRLAVQILKKTEISIIFCRTSLAGIIGYMLHRKTGIPYTVESFEPHAAYMLDAKEWGKRGISYQFQQWFEAKQKKTAAYLLPVAENYLKQLKMEGVPEKKLMVAPCAVNLEQFSFQEERRQQIRMQHRLETKIIGIYAGKFGGIYLEEEAFKLFQISFETIPGFHLILLTPAENDFLRTMFEKYKIDTSRVWAGLVKHDEVPHWLSAADFAFSLHSPTPSKRFVSPIKNGEYWANGLPIVMPEGIGDDSNLLIQYPEAGEVFQLDDASMKLAVEGILGKIHGRPGVKKLAGKYRSFSLVEGAYKKILADDFVSITPSR